MKDSHRIIGGVRRIEDPVALAALNAQEQQLRKKSKRQYVVEINLNSESLEKSAQKKPALPLSPKQIVEAPAKVPQSYIDKLNRAIEDLHSFESQNARLAQIAQSQQSHIEQLQQQNRQLHQQMHSSNQINQNRVLEQKQVQLQRYCSRIRLIQQKLETYELERQANMVLSNFYSDLAGLFGVTEIPLEQLRSRIQQAIRNSSTTKVTLEAYQQRQHTQNEELNQLLKRLNQATFRKDQLELKYVDCREHLQQTTRQVQDLSKQLDRLQQELRVTKDALGFVRQQNEQLKRNSRVQEGKQSGIIKENISKMDSIQRENALLKKETEELRRLINNYKQSMTNAEIAHANETSMLNSMLAELRKTYTQTNKLKQNEVFQVKSLKQALADAQRTIQKLTASTQLRNELSQDYETLQRDNQYLRKELDHVNELFTNLQNDNSTLHNTGNLQRRTVQQLRQEIIRLQEDLKNSHQSEDMVGEFQRELSIKTSQYEFLQGELQRARNSVTAQQTKQKQQIFELQNQVMKYEQQNQRLMHQLEALKENSKRGDTAFETAQQREMQLEQNILKYSQQLTNTLTKLTTVTEQNKQLRQEFSKVNHQSQQQFLQLQKEACDRQAMLSSLKEQMVQKDKHNQQMQEQVKKASIQIAQLTKDLRVAQSQMDSMMRSQDSNQMSIQRVRSTFQSEIDRVNHKVTSLEMSLSSAKAELAEADSKLVVQQKQMERLQSQKQSQMQQLNLKIKMIQQFDMELEDARTTNRRFEAELSSMRVQVNTNQIDREADRRQLTIQVDQLNQSLADCRAELEAKFRVETELKAQIRKKQLKIEELEQLQGNVEHSQKLAENELEHLNQLIQQIRSDAKQAQNRQKQWADRRQKQLQQDLNRYIQENEYLKSESMKVSVALSQTQRKCAQIEGTTESRLQRFKIQIQSQQHKNNKMRQDYEEQLRIYTNRLKEADKQRQQLEEKLKQTGLRCTNLTTVYHQMQQAALAYKDQCETLRSQYQGQQIEHQQAISRLQQTSGREAQLERQMADLRLKYGREIENLKRQSDNMSRDLHQRNLSQQASIEHLDQQLKKSRETINKLNDDIARNQEQRRILQMQNSSRNMQKQQLQRCQQKLNKVTSELSQVKQQLQIATLEYQGRVTELRQQINNYRNNQSQAFVSEQRFKALKDQTYALQSEKVTLSTKLQMTEIKVEQLESQNTHLKKQVSDLRNQRRISTSAVVTVEPFTTSSSYGIQNPTQMRKSMVNAQITFKPVSSHNGQLKSRPSSAYHSSSATNLNANYSQYYQENLKQIKSGQLRFTAPAPVKRVSALIKKEEFKEKQSALNMPNIPRSPKQINRNSVDLALPRTSEFKFGSSGFNVNTVVSTQSLNNDVQDINFQRQ